MNSDELADGIRARAEASDRMIREANPVTCTVLDAMRALRSAMWPDAPQGPVGGMVVLPPCEFDRLRDRMAGEEFGRMFWVKRGRKQHDRRRWTMMEGIRVVSDEAAEIVADMDPCCPTRREA
mgnify:CR=1 FL=1